MTDSGPSESGKSSPPILTVDVANRCNVAFHQNQIPVIGGIELQNATQADLSYITIEIASVPEFLEPKKFTFDRLKAGSIQRLSPVPVALQPAMLLKLNERVRGEIVVTATVAGKEVARTVEACELLSPHEWTGLSAAPELIASFVRPNDPAVDAVLRRAAAKLERGGRASALDGYAAGRKSRVWEVAEAIWAALSDEAIVYALPPASFETDGQKVRSPCAILERKVGTCLDLSLLLAACYEQVGFNPVVVLTKGHALVGLWLINQEFAQAVIDEPQALRKRRDLEDLILIETTLLTQRHRFASAVEQGRVQVNEGAPKGFEAAVDIKRARMRRITPLSLVDDATSSPKVEVKSVTDMELGAAPVFVEEIKVDEDTTQTLTRIEKWKRKLLDLSLRNKLLNFKAGKGSVKLNCPEPAVLEDKLAASEKIRLQPKAKVMDSGDPRNAELNRQVVGEDAARAYARDALQRGDIHTDLESEELESRLTDLFRSARSSMEEGGANSLHLALGFVRWSPAGKKGGDYRAPLILLPVSLERRTARSGFKLVRHDDDARINPTLLQMLRQDFEVSIPEFEGAELPMDGSGLDVKKIWSIARKHLLDAKGFEVTEDVVLSTFSFTKYLMWKDLVDRTELLKKNPVVSHLIDSPTAAYGDGSSLPREDRLDSEVTSKSLLMPLPADSSQTAAVLAASRRKDFVLFGPPGTGKSQTIANLIVNTLGEGRTVLFVSQKTTALEVVRQRLEKLGLGNFCLEVHSAKAQKSAVLGQLQHAWEERCAETVQRWEEKTEELDQLRARLNGVVTALHSTRRNGLTAYGALGRVIAGRNWHPDLRLAFPHLDYHDQAAMRRLRDLCGTLRLALSNVGDLALHPLRLVRQTEWSPAWRTEFGAAIAIFGKAASEFSAAAEPVAALLGLAEPGYPDASYALLVLCGQAFAPNSRDSAELLHQDTAELGRRLREWAQDRRNAEEALVQLSCSYREGVYSLNFPELLEEWRQAQNANFLVRGAKKKKVWAAFAPFTSSPAPQDVGLEIAKLMDVAAAWELLSQHNVPMAEFGSLWRGDDTDPSDLAAALDWVDETRRAAFRCSELGLDGEYCVQALQRILLERQPHLYEGGPIHLALQHLHACFEAFQTARERLAQLAGLDGDFATTPDDNWLATVSEQVSGWGAALQRTQSWCAWQRASADASLEGLEPLMNAVHEGRVPADDLSYAFELAYARWWVDRIVDAEKPLREFIGTFHEDAISRFAKLDEELADLSRKVVAARLSTQIPPRTGFGTDPEWGTLSRELTKKARHMPLRQLFGQMPKALTALAPCMMMSPLSVAQYLPSETAPFDIVIFDEASQMPVWDAVGAIARGKQVIVVGDPKQLPPTTFFDRADGEVDDAAEIEDLESILDECLAANIPHKKLTWHYRSRHESLIAFSNERYYDGSLVTFPSPVTNDRAVRYTHVPGGFYERGGGRVNRAEAIAVVGDVVRRLCDPRFRAENASLGIVTFNSEQQKLIENLLDQERRARPDIETYFGAEWHEPVFVKNLESVQGDERDVILFSVGYGPDAAGHITQNYGPLNLDGGARRLNVAITRARTELVVFATLRPEQIDLSRSKGAGVRDFKHFLEFAQRGRSALVEASAPTGREEDSEFERSVRKALEAKGWIIHPQVGVSGFRIDLGIVHPDAPGRYLAAVECDGATYHRSATARDRDRLREAVLRNLGWRVRRVWSTDWWNDAERALEEVHARLEADLTEQRIRDIQDLAVAEPVSAPPVPVTGTDHKQSANELPSLVPDPIVDAAGELAQEAAADADRGGDPVRYADLNVQSAPALAFPDSSVVYVVTDLAAAGFKAEPDKFYQTSYRPILRRIAAHVIDTEGPIYDDVLVRRIARFHGLKRSGPQIKSVILDVVERKFPKTMEGERRVYWPENSSCTVEHCRLTDPETRDHSDIPDVELLALARGHAASDASPQEVAALMAQDLRIGRLRQVTRDRFEAIARRARS